MDAAKTAYFRDRYSALEIDALAELHQTRESLAEEAGAALDEVLTQRGIAPAMLSTYCGATPPEPTPAPRRHWKLVIVQLLGALVAMVAASALPHVIPRWISLLLVVGFGIWWAFGKLGGRKERSQHEV